MGNSRLAFRLCQQASCAVCQTGYQGHGAGVIAVIAQRGFNVVAPNTAFSRRSDIGSPFIYAHRVRFQHPYMAIDARALIPPAFISIRFHIDGQQVQAVVGIDHFGDIHGKRGISAEIPVHQMAIDPNLCVGDNAVKHQYDPAAPIRFIQTEDAAIPAVLPGDKAVRRGDGLVDGIIDGVIVR